MPLFHEGKSPQQIIEETKKAIKAMPLRVANLALNHFLKNFDTESWEGVKWKERSKDAPRNTGRKLLRDTGTLYKAMSKRVSGANVSVFIAPPADVYGAMHNTGGIITSSVSRQSKKFAWAMFLRTKNPMWKAMALQAVGTQRKVSIPKRQFIGDSPALNKKINTLIEQSIEKINGL